MNTQIKYEVKAIIKSGAKTTDEVLKKLSRLNWFKSVSILDIAEYAETQIKNK